MAVVEWQQDLDVALGLAREQRRIVFADFHKTPG